MKYIGAGASTALAGWSVLVTGGCGSALDETSPNSLPKGIWTLGDGAPDWEPVPYPAPLPGQDASRPDRQRLAHFAVQDTLVLPEGFAYAVLAQWGDEFGAAGHRVRFGYNNDYTGLTRIAGTEDEYWLLVNHEYVSMRPWLESWGEIYGGDPPEIVLRREEGLEDGRLSVNGWDFPSNELDLDSSQARAMPDEVRTVLADVAQKVLDTLGVSVLRLRGTPDGGLQVMEDADDHKRISAFRAHNAPQAVFRFSGPAQALMQGPPPGTMCNCSGGTTPWGTFLTCEENFQQHSQEEITPQGELAAHPRSYLKADAHKVDDEMQHSHQAPLRLKGLGRLLDPPLDGRHYGWVTEINPENGNLTKHTHLGRFRHENVALRCRKGQPLAAYMGDDRRGGHVWKFVSRQPVEDPADPSNSRLLEEGTLYVARFESGYSGRWIPLLPSTPLRRPQPEHCPSGHMHLPDRPRGGTVKVGPESSPEAEITVEQWIERIESFAGKPFQECTLADLVNPWSDEAEQGVLGVLVMEAFAMANCIGGTPTARPEDLEVHPLDQSVYIAFTDATEGSEGSPDQRVFPNSKKENSRQYGALYRLAEGPEEDGGSGPESEEFHWGVFVSSGEVAEQGGGFACADNLLLDPAGCLWMVTDISTSVQNFPTRRREDSGTLPGQKYFPGVFGNNAMFYIPTRGPHAGRPFCFATGPVECEMAGPTFSPDSQALVLSVQHPGEIHGQGKGQEEKRQVHLVRDRQGKSFEQVRTVPTGSHFPHGQRGRAPRPAVVCITRMAKGHA
ncbi:MAG TPA: alkaline phosphatase PhoX [Acidobacteriota bacterium]|nr:alkaline phosphatase PhoX [Acidobacteriota bacterium]